MTDQTRPAAARPLSLDGEWQLAIEGGPSVLVQVPGPWTAQVPGHDFSTATAVYRREFAVARLPQDDRAILVFGGVNHRATVRLNGVEVGRHVGGWVPFEFDVTDAISEGDNVLEVEVGYPGRFRDAAGEPPIGEVPHGKQTWYGSSAGIWQSVTIEMRPAQHVGALVLQAGGSTGSLSGRVVLALPADGATRVRLVASPVGIDAPLSEWMLPVVPGAKECEVRVTVDSPLLWSPDEPTLYAVTAIVESPAGRHEVSIRTGFRDIEARDGAILLNGHPLEIRGVLDQDYHPGSSTIPESDDALRELFTEVKRLGFNLLRCHIKRPDHRYYALADELGLLVWTELPSWLTMTDEAATTGLDLMRELIDLDGHHPSIVIWTVMNESWGVDLRDPQQRAWLLDAYRTVKALTPGTLVVDNSACEPNFHLESDLDDYHVYRSIPEGRRDWDEKLRQFAERADWSYSPHGDARRSGREPLVLSEYGNWGLPLTTDQYAADGSEPWWFASGAPWAFGAGDGTGLLRRFVELGLDEVFGSWERLVVALQHAQMDANRYQTGAIRALPSLSGYVITQLSDVQWEANGLFDMRRSPKAGLDRFSLINRESAVVVRPRAYSAEPGEGLVLDVHCVPPRTGRPRADVSATLIVRVGDEVVHCAGIDLGERQSVAIVGVMPSIHGEIEIAAELIVDGELRARDTAAIAVVIAESPVLHRPVHAADRELARWLAGIGIRVVDGPPSAGAALVTRRFDDEAQALARGGGRALVIVEDEHALADAFNHLPPASLQPRGGDGDWVPHQDWLRRDGAFASVPGGPLLGIPFENLLGGWTLSGIDAPLRPARVHSGLFSGWLRHAAATSATVAFSRGEATITTLRLRGDGGRDVLRDAVARAFVAHVARE